MLDGPPGQSFFLLSTQKTSMANKEYIPDVITKEQAAREKAAVNSLPKCIFGGSNQTQRKKAKMRTVFESLPRPRIHHTYGLYKVGFTSSQSLM